MDHCAQIATHVMFVLVLNLTVRLRVRRSFAAIRGSVMRNMDSVASRTEYGPLCVQDPYPFVGLDSDGKITQLQF